MEVRPSPKLINRDKTARARESVGWLSVACCVASLVIPVIIFCSFAAGEPPGRFAAERPAGFLHLHHTGLVGSLMTALTNVTHERHCALQCEHTRDCTGFVFSARKRKCWRASEVSALVPGAHVSSFLRQHAAWPRSHPNRVRWRRNATLVVGWAGGTLGWLRDLHGQVRRRTTDATCTHHREIVAFTHGRNRSTRLTAYTVALFRTLLGGPGTHCGATAAGVGAPQQPLGGQRSEAKRGATVTRFDATGTRTARAAGTRRQALA